jgi:hypothetical protein
MRLLVLEELQQFLEEEFTDVNPALADGLLLRLDSLDSSEIQRAESGLGLGNLPGSFTEVVQTYDFGNFSLFNTQFGTASTGSLDWLLAYNDVRQFGFEQFLLQARQLALVLVAIGDPFAFFLQAQTGAVGALISEQPLPALLPVAKSFPHFIQGLGTAYQARRKGQVHEFGELARQEFGESAYPFWHELML